ncbi:MAG: nucleotide exchange factor GrpE [candidate division Zixibacteria bacterium]|nr:nucleotide exchange factor GrpE [candidate division Zixibacteria bacterium]
MRLQRKSLQRKIKTSNENILIQILEVMDNFQRALEVAKSATDFDSLHRGTELINQHLSDILKKEGIKKIQVVGQKFDPHLHEAVMKVESDKYPDGMIAEEIAAGYMLNGKIIRHSKVAVSGGKMEVAKDNTDE